MEALLGLIIGAILTVGIITYIKYLQSKNLTKSQSLLLLDKIKKVCKFITVEGDFAEIYHYEDVKERFLKLINSRKKALVIINAKAHVGFNFSKVNLHANRNAKTIVLKDFPQPEVLSIETDLNYYDKKIYTTRLQHYIIQSWHRWTLTHIILFNNHSNLIGFVLIAHSPN
jgi:hypothetical protein